MAIREFKISIRVNNTQLDCGGGETATATVIVGITTDGDRTRYAVSLWDHNVLESDDQLGERQVGTIEAMDPVREFRDTHEFTLSCTDDCKIQGDYGRSQKDYAWLYGYGQEWDYMLSQPYAGGKEVSTSSVTVECEEIESRRK